MAAAYRHTQVGFVTIGAIGTAALVSAVAGIATRTSPALAGAVVLAVAVLLFGWLTVVVDEDVILVRMGAGLLQRRIRVKQIVDVKVVRTGWIWGWGIRWTPHGWLWNVSGTRGVELRYANGRRFRIGSDEPEELAAAIRDRIAVGSTHGP